MACLLIIGVEEEDNQRRKASDNREKNIMDKEMTARAEAKDKRDEILFYLSLAGGTAALGAAYILILSIPSMI